MDHSSRWIESTRLAHHGFYQHTLEDRHGPVPLHLHYFTKDALLHLVLLRGAHRLLAPGIYPVWGVGAVIGHEVHGCLAQHGQHCHSRLQRASGVPQPWPLLRLPWLIRDRLHQCRLFLLRIYSYNYFATGEVDKAVFLFLAIQMLWQMLLWST